MIKKQIVTIKRDPWLLAALPLSIISIIAILILRLFVKIRVGFLRCDRLGHFAPNTELYLYYKGLQEHKNRTVDLFYYPRPVCNHQLSKMWKRELIILPWFFLRPVDLIIRSFKVFNFLRVIEAIGEDRDVENIMDKTKPHLSFTSDEDNLGRDTLEKFGVPNGAKFICLNVRDSAYLKEFPTIANSDEYHNYRDSDVQNFILVAEDLADRGYYVFRMGAKVYDAIKSKHPRVIDYAANGMRTDFMDVWLGANCDFCISTATGFDAIPYIFRRPIVFVNNVPIGYFFTFSEKFIAITKHHINQNTGKKMTLSEIFESGVGYSLTGDDYINNNVSLVENTPEEIRDAALEMHYKLNQEWEILPEDKDLQSKFQKIYQSFVSQFNLNLHGEIRSKYSASFLRNNKEWLN